jgi:transcription-repair coupling factor (superfamily II helicase)
VVWKNHRLFLTVPDPADDPYFHGTLFEPFMAALGASGHRFVMKDSRTGRLRAIVQDVPTLEAAERILRGVASGVADRAATTEKADAA